MVFFIQTAIHSRYWIKSVRSGQNIGECEDCRIDLHGCMSKSYFMSVDVISHPELSMKTFSVMTLLFGVLA